MSFAHAVHMRCTCGVHAVHLEYKVANQFGSFPIIYKACRDTFSKPYNSYDVTNDDIDDDTCVI